MLLAAFVTMCEGYLSVLRTIELWGAFFYTKLGTSVREVAAQCGAFIAVRRPSPKNAFPTVKLPQSVKMWQQSYFYVKNVDPAVDFLNLPAYAAGPPAGRRPNWSYRAKTLSPSGAAAIARLRVLTQSEGLTGPDLLSAFVAHRVLPLQGRPHMIC